MNLIVDIGNTLAKVAIVEHDKIIHFQSYSNLTLKDIEIAVVKHAVQKSIISVVGNIDNEILNYLTSNFSTIILDQNTKIPLKNKYSTPKTLGYDRIAVAVGANYLYPNRDILIIDAGTAITYELVASDGAYLGGAISPGISLRFRSLNNHTAKLPLLEKVEIFPVIGQNTNDCIYSGVLNGVISEIDGYIEKIKTNFPEIYVLLTGGDSNFFANKLKNSIFVNQNLMIVGLNRILEFNV